LVVPFFSLLLLDVKRNPRALAAVAGLLLFMVLVHTYYLVMPSFPGTGLDEHWMDFLTPVGIGGIWGAYYLFQMRGVPWLPQHDENQAAAVRLQELDTEQGLRGPEHTHA
jgi:hypothetical protein